MLNRFLFPSTLCINNNIEKILLKYCVFGEKKTVYYYEKDKRKIFNKGLIKRNMTSQLNLEDIYTELNDLLKGK